MSIMLQLVKQVNSKKELLRLLRIYIIWSSILGYISKDVVYLKLCFDHILLIFVLHVKIFF